MAFFEDIFEGWASAGLIGVGVVLAAPTIVTLVGTMVRPLAQRLGSGFSSMTNTARGVTNETGERPQDMDRRRTKRAEEEDETREDRELQVRDRKRREQEAKKNEGARRQANRRNQRARRRRRSVTARAAA
jgi:hypothetical protein